MKYNEGPARGTLESMPFPRHRSMAEVWHLPGEPIGHMPLPHDPRASYRRYLAKDRAYYKRKRHD